MKRLALLGLIAVFVLGVAATASAADIKASGQYRIEAVNQANWDLVDKGDADGSNWGKTNDQEDFNIWMRVRAQFDFIANENLKGVLATEVGSNAWGESAVFDLGSSPVAIEVRRAYVDFKWPDTKVGIRAGYMGLSLPAAIGGGSMILDEEVSALTVTSPITDNVSVLAGYARALSGTATHRANHDAYDLGVLALPLDFDGIKLTPFLMYGFAEYDAIAESGVPAWEQGLLTLNGTNAASSKKTWWAGLAFEMTMFDPFVVKADLNYGSVDGNGDADDRSGWLFDASLAYTGWDFMTPELFFAYTSGEDGNSTHGDGDSERMPVLRVSNWHVGSFWFGNPSYSYDLRGSTNRYQMLGFWTVGLTLKDISFLEKLSHEFTLLYAQGTNDKDCATARANGIDNSYGIVYGRTLTEKDSIVEVDLNTKYKIYEELSALFDIGYVNADYDTNYWGNDYNGGDMWKVALSVDYTF